MPNATHLDIDRRVPAEMRAEIGELIAAAARLHGELLPLLARWKTLVTAYEALPSTDELISPGDLDHDLWVACGGDMLRAVLSAVQDGIARTLDSSGPSEDWLASYGIVPFDPREAGR